MTAVPQFALGRDDEMALPEAAWSNGLGRVMPYRQEGPRFRAAIAAAGAISLTLHVAVAALFLMTWQRNELGVLSEPTNAINVEFIATPTLESAPASVQETPVGSESSVAQAVGAEADSEAKSLSEVKPDESAEVAPVAAPVPAPASPTVVPSIESTETIIAGAAEIEDSLPPPQASSPAEPEQTPQRVARQAEQPKKRTEKVVDAKTAKKAADADAQTKKKGGAASRASAATKPGASRASASTGDIAGYAARVRARVAGNKPSGGGLKGTPTVSFGVSQSGGLSFVRLKRSSGVAALDQAAMGAVRRAAPFPPPPPGVSASRLSFTMPIYFR
jgi:protein TonB